MENTPTPLNTIESIQQRRTFKILADEPLPVKPCDTKLIETLINAAYYAPFHYSAADAHRSQLTSPLPYRLYVLDSQNCRKLAEILPTLNEKNGKVPEMLNAADYVIYTTWCPEPEPATDAHNNDDVLFTGSLVNMEHLAAASAAVQSLLLTATALGHENYWCSGGTLRQPSAYELLDIPRQEITLGALFLFPSIEEIEDVPTARHFFSKRRDKRGELADVYRMAALK